MPAVKTFLALVAGLFACSPLLGCIVVGGGRRGGLFLFPGGFGFLFVIVVLFLVLRRR